VGLDQCPLVIGEIARVMVHSHAITTHVTPRMFDLWDSHLDSTLQIPYFDWAGRKQTWGAKRESQQ
jgi:hypothetical protein